MVRNNDNHSGHGLAHIELVEPRSSKTQAVFREDNEFITIDVEAHEDEFEDGEIFEETMAQTSKANKGMAHDKIPTQGKGKGKEIQAKVRLNHPKDAQLNENVSANICTEEVVVPVDFGGEASSTIKDKEKSDQEELTEVTKRIAGKTFALV